MFRHLKTILDICQKVFKVKTGFLDFHNIFKFPRKNHFRIFKMLIFRKLKKRWKSKNFNKQMKH